MIVANGIFALTVEIQCVHCTSFISIIKFIHQFGSLTQNMVSKSGIYQINSIAVEIRDFQFMNVVSV